MCVIDGVKLKENPITEALLRTTVMCVCARSLAIRWIMGPALANGTRSAQLPTSLLDWEASAEPHGSTPCLKDPEVLTILCVHQTGRKSFYRAESLMTLASHTV